jgi:hypothetical protein
MTPTFTLHLLIMTLKFTDRTAQVQFTATFTEGALVSLTGCLTSDGYELSPIDFTTIPPNYSEGEGPDNWTVRFFNPLTGAVMFIHPSKWAPHSFSVGEYEALIHALPTEAA